MKEKFTKIFKKISPYISALSRNKYLQAISGGMMATLPITLIGSIAVLLLVFPLKFVTNTISALGLTGVLSTANTFTIGCLALYVAFLVGKNLVQQFIPEDDGTSAGIISLLSFLLVTPLGQTVEEVSAIPTTWLGSAGVFSAMIIGLVSGRIYVLAKQRGWTIKMPESVPPMVMKVFTGLIPSILIGVLFIIVNKLFSLTSFGSMHQAIYTILQTPLQNIGGSLPAMLIVVTLAQTLWFFGIHGTNVTNPIVTPIWLALDVMNLNAVMAGEVAPNIIGNAFFMTVTFGGTALGLVVLMLRSKSKQYRQLGKLAVVPALFGITEPVIFGTPLVLNFKFAIPFIFNNAICIIIAYVLTVLNIVPRFMGTTYVFGLPIGFSAAIQGSIKIIILQLALQAFSILLWLPWFKSAEKEAMLSESKVEEAV